MTKYWIVVANKDKVNIAQEKGAVQLCHGKVDPLQRISQGDWILYYSPKETSGGTKPCRKFTAIGRLQARKPYHSSDAWQKTMLLLPAKEISIRPLIEILSCIPNKKWWGLAFRSGFLGVPERDFYLIASSMGIKMNDGM